MEEDPGVEAFYSNSLVAQDGFHYEKKSLGSRMSTTLILYQRGRPFVFSVPLYVPSRAFNGHP